MIKFFLKTQLFVNNLLKWEYNKIESRYSSKCLPEVSRRWNIQADGMIMIPESVWL